MDVTIENIPRSTDDVKRQKNLITRVCWVRRDDDDIASAMTRRNNNAQQARSRGDSVSELIRA
jgi:hypothetical protein